MSAKHNQIMLKRCIITHREGGGGGTKIWFGRGCAAQALKPLPNKGHLGGFFSKNDPFPTIFGCFSEKIWKFWKH